jgi:hypothetical protein
MENANPVSLIEKASEQSRSLLFGLLVNCIFSGQANGRCPLSSLRENLTFEEKYDLVMGLTQEEIFQALDQHEKCYENECYSQCKSHALAS